MARRKNDFVIYDTHAEIILRNINGKEIARAIIDLDDVERCRMYGWAITGKNGYVKNRNSEIGKLHRFILNYYGKKEVDHINRNKLDNRKENLRIVDKVINRANNGAECIYFDRGKWRVKFARFGKRYYVGAYNTKEEAVIARDIKLKEIENNSESLLRKHKRKIQTKVKGVYPAGKRYWANFNADGKQHYVGTFDTIEEAIKEREKAIKKYKTDKQ